MELRTTPFSNANTNMMNKPLRHCLPDTRQSIVHKFNITGHEGYLIVGKYEDNSPGELFIKVAKEGSTMRGLMDAIGILTSLALQYGIPVDKLVEKFKGTSFEPQGFTHNKEISTTSSMLDYIFRWLDGEFPLQEVENEGPGN